LCVSYTRKGIPILVREWVVCHGTRT